MPWEPCDDPAHAHLKVLDDDGEEVTLRVPFEHRYDPIGWGDRPRVIFDHEEGELEGFVHSRGRQGVTVVDHKGRVHRLVHGAYRARPVTTEASARRNLRKGKALKPGQRWITVRPNGPGTDGVPVLISPNPDGSYSVTGGAGGKLNHLRLTGIKSPEEYEKDAREKAKEKRKKKKADAAAREEAKADRTPEQVEEDEQEEADAGIALAEAERDKLMAEAAFIDKVRRTMGGVDSPLDQKKINLIENEGARHLLQTQHHKKMLRQAIARSKMAAEQLVQDEVGRREANARFTEQELARHDISEETRDQARIELALVHQEEEEARQRRRARKTRQTGGKTAIGEAEQEQVAEYLETVDKAEIEERVEALDGAERASLILEHRRAQAMLEAKTAMEAGDTETAASKVRRAEVLRARIDRMEEMEADPEDGPGKALRSLAFVDRLAAIGKQAADARRLGLVESQDTPLQEAEAQELADLLADRQKLREAEKRYRALAEAVETEDWRAARRAFALPSTEGAEEKVAASIEESVRREVAQRLRGVTSTTRGDTLESVSNGMYEAVADVGLVVGRQRYVDRRVVDAIGVKNAATLVRFGLEQDGHTDTDRILAALEDFHVENQVAAAEAAIARAESFAPGLVDKVEDVGDIETALSQLDILEADAERAQRAVGSALGQLEAYATMAQTFREDLPEDLIIGGDASSTIRWLHGAGLQPGDYKVESLGQGEYQVVVNRDRWGKLITRESAEVVEQRKLAEEIKRGDHDEEGYLPRGIISRPVSEFKGDVARPESWRAPFQVHGDLEANLRDHVASRLADGEPLVDVVPSLYAPQYFDAVPDREAYKAAVDKLFPLRDEHGEMQKYDAARYQDMVRDYMERRHPGAAEFHAQTPETDTPKGREAIARTLADVPHTQVAFKDPGELTPQDRRVIHNYFYDRKGIDRDVRFDQAAYDEEFAKLGPEPDPSAGTLSMFGGGGPSPEWRDWHERRIALASRHKRAGGLNALASVAALREHAVNDQARAKYDAQEAEIRENIRRNPTSWTEYVETHGDRTLALMAIQAEMRSDFAQRYAEHYGRIVGRPLQVAPVEIPNAEQHIKAMLSRDEWLQEQERAKRIKTQLREREKGKFAHMGGEGSVNALFAQSEARDVAAVRAQVGLFGAAVAPAEASTVEPSPARTTLRPGERWSLGERAEQTLAAMVGGLGAAFKADEPVDLFPGLNMDGDRVTQQRAIKMIRASGGRFGGFLGTGAGKSLISIGSATDHIESGDAVHAVFATPVAVQEQFAGEMLKFTEPGRYKWSTGQGGRDARLAALADTSTHMKVFTHQSLRDDLLSIMAEHHGREPKQMLEDMRRVDARTRAQWLAEAREARGIPPWFFYFDEAHMGTARGEESTSSATHLVLSAAGHPLNASQAVFGTATPHKNDETEVHSMAAMVHPDRYADRTEFLQNFGQDLANNPRAVQRELAPYTMMAKVDPPTKKISTSNPRIIGGRKVEGGTVQVSAEQKGQLEAVREAYDRARAARRRGEVDIEAVKTLNPGRFEGVPEGEHETIARDLSRSLGTMRENAISKVLETAPLEQNPKHQAIVDTVMHDLENGTWTNIKTGQVERGKPSIIFVNHRREGRALLAALEARGARVGFYHGGLTHDEREKIRLGFQPPKGVERSLDVFIATSAAEAGVNLQTAKVVHHASVPLTEKSHNQRTGRAYRQGQRGDVDVHDWYTDTEFDRIARSRLKGKTGLAQPFQDPIADLDDVGLARYYHRSSNERTWARPEAA